MNALGKRELLLSLKFCTIEACFSVPMLNLTTGNFPFVIAFAIQVLGYSDSAVGLLAASPFICLFLQTPIIYFLQRFFSLYQILAYGFVLNALPWTVIAFFPWLGESSRWVFGAVVWVSTLANAVCGVAWSAAVSELIPIAIRGKYTGARNLMFGFWTLVVVFAAGQLVDHHQNAPAAFGVIFTLAAASRLVGFYFLTRMKFPASVRESRPQESGFSTFTAVFHDRSFVRLLLFTGLFGFFLNLGNPFYSVYVLKELPLTLGDLTILTALSTFGGLASLKTWGPLSDRFGNKPIMVTCASIWLSVAALSWLFSGPQHYAQLYLNYFITGFMMAGFQQIGQFNLMIKMVPPQNNAHYISVYFSFTNMLIAFGPIVGAMILHRLPPRLGTWMGQPLTRYHVLIVGSLSLCLLSLSLLRGIREPAERSVKELVMVMRKMREFNPVLGLATLAHFMFTPRGITRLARLSVRTLRRQTHAVSEVGEELVEGGRRIIQQPFKK